MDQRAQPIPVVWRKSSYSEAGNCVEVGCTAQVILVRDSKNRAGPVLSFSKLTWAAFLADVNSGLFGDNSSPQ